LTKPRAGVRIWQTSLDMASTLTIAQQIKAPIQRELDALELELAQTFRSDIELVAAIGGHLAAVKGKRIRPVLALLGARLGRPDAATAVRIAQAIELVHTATLLHDDSIDRSHIRRGLPTVNKLWNDQVSVIMGDYLFCKAFKMLYEAGMVEVAAVLSAGSDSMTYGEMFQMDLRGRFDVDEETYLRMIKHKTASLFASACEAGAIVGGLPPEARCRLRDYGEYLGIAFQIVDDVLDFVGSADAMGKPVGNDLKDGRVTLPLIAALRNASAAGGSQAERIKQADLAETVRFIRANGGVEYSQRLAREFADKAAACAAFFEPTPPARSLLLLADHVVGRDR
jgi:octaprenyl-diphosphate synthase